MNIFVDALVFVLSAYLAFTNSLALHIENLMVGESTDVTEERMDDSATRSDIVHLYSFFRQAIPDVLLRSQEYQQAALTAAAGLTESTTNDPLEALVNVFCTIRTSEYIRTTTGTGFFIDADGVILTNAHIAQFLLLEKTDRFGDASCIIRSGSPAVAQYEAGLLYIPPAWVQENAAVLNDAVPMGTGERDYALLYVKKRIDNEPLPAVFPALPVDTDLLPTSVRNDAVVAAGYPATDLIARGPSTALFSVKADSSISELYTFGSNYADVLSIRGSNVGAEGASGGPVVNGTGEVIAMIATRGNDDVDGAGSLRAITLSHIDRTIKEETGFSLSDNLNGDLNYRATVFAETLTPFLIALLEEGQSE